MPNPPYRVLVSTIADHIAAQSPPRLAIKERILYHLQQHGIEPQIIGELGSIALNLSWTFDDPQEVLRRCQGAVILGLTRWELLDHANQLVHMITEYSHFEGAVALERHLPTLLIAEDAVLRRGILFNGGGKFIIGMPPKADASWVDSDAFQQRFAAWVDEVHERFHVFIGYSSGAKATAQAIIEFLKANDVTVMDWMTDFRPGGTILDEIKRAEKLCMGGLFLFTSDDELKSGDTLHAAPRDNVIFEAGYFINTKSDERVLIIREEGTKMPADIGGHIYLSLADRHDISPIKADLLRFIQDRF